MLVKQPTLRVWKIPNILIVSMPRNPVVTVLFKHQSNQIELQIDAFLSGNQTLVYHKNESFVIFVTMHNYFCVMTCTYSKSYTHFQLLD